MKNFIINKCIEYIKNNTNYNEIKLKEIKYGLEGLYLTISKLIIIFILAIILNMCFETIIFLLIFNILRCTSFGIHATKSWICLLSSTIIFISLPYLCSIININLTLKCVLGIIGIYFMFKNSPADTHKKPIINKKRRAYYKFISTINCIIMVFISIHIKNNFISNCLLFSIILQNFMISPAIYKFFKLPYNNYITFLKEHPEFIQ